MADKDGVADEENVAVGIQKAVDIESWTSRQIEYLHRRRAAFKGVITKNTKKAEDIVSRNGSRKRVEAEEWLDQLRSEFEEEILKHRADEPPSVFGDFTVDRLSDVDDKASQLSEVSDDSLASSAAEKLAKAEIAALKAKQEKNNERKIEIARKSSAN
ncbi:hypothetical protein ACROYT_G001094 [Oculina patagonica]